MLARIPQKILLSIAAGVLLVGAGAGVGAYALSGDKTVVKTVTAPARSTASNFASNSQLSVGQIYKQDSPGVVEITVTTQGAGGGFFGQGGGSAQGSGFVYDSQGHIVTDEHVVDGASAISVRFSNGATYRATVVGTDGSSDLAVIKVNAPSTLLHPLTLADSSNVAVGDDVVAIGSPFGLEGTITSGIVSALHRDITAPNNFTINDTIQTDAAINHGNSGGVLLNTAGQVIGVTAQIDSESGGNDGVGFAIPSNTVRSIVSQLVGGGAVQRAYLGVHIQTIPSDAATAMNVPTGIEITSVVSGSPASKAGLKGSSSTTVVNGQQYATGGDVITKVDGQAVTSADALQAEVAGKKPGTQVKLTISRAGETKTVTVTLGTRPS